MCFEKSNLSSDAEVLKSIIQQFGWAAKLLDDAALRIKLNQIQNYESRFE